MNRPCSQISSDWAKYALSLDWLSNTSAQVSDINSNTAHARCDSIEEKMVALVKQLNLYLVMHEKEHNDIRQEFLLLYEPENEVAH